MPTDDGKRRGGHRSDLSWPEIRAAYEAGETVSQLARRYGTTRGSIAKHRDAEKWVVATQTIVEAARSNVISIATRKAVENLGGEEKLVKDAEIAIATTLEAQAPLFAKASSLLSATFDRAIAGELKLGVTQGETTAVSDLLNALSKFTRDTRLINGLREGVANTDAESNEGEKPKADQVVLVVRERQKESA